MTDDHGRIRWGLVPVDGSLLYYEQREDGWRACEFGGNGGMHTISETKNARLYALVQADVREQGAKHERR